MNSMIHKAVNDKKLNCFYLYPVVNFLYNYIMKVKAIVISAVLIAGLLIASCSSASKTCPAYGKAQNEQLEDIRS